ncbi:MAG: hypothetical protein AABX34_04980 [Nanoarchaeota archaeon]
MATEMQPNRLYTMYQAFGDSLFALDRFWTKEGDKLITSEDAISQTKKLQDSATFKGSKFFPIFDLESLSLEQLTRTADGEPIYFPADKPSYGDITGTYGSATGLAVRTGRYSPLDFMIDPVLNEDLIGEFFISQRPSHVLPDGRGIKVKNYRYKMLLRSGKDIFVSDKPAVFDGEHPLPYVIFNEWSPINFQQNGMPYIPLEYKKVGPLEIMLQQK